MSRAVPALAVAAALVIAGCGGSGGRRTLRVFAAASLADVFATIESDFEATHPDVDVELVVGGSSSLVAQVIEGAPADVLATADEVTMQRGIRADERLEPTVFATNAAVLVTTPDLASTPLERVDDLGVAVCAPEVPCGRAAGELFADLGLAVEPVTLEPSVRGVVTKLRLGEVDAGVVYTTDLVGDAALVRLTATADAEIVNRYPIAVTAPTGTPAADDAADFVAHVVGPDGQRRLAEAGFGPP